MRNNLVLSTLFSALLLVGSMSPLAAFAGTNPCLSVKFTYLNTRSNYRSAVRDLQRSQRNYNVDYRAYTRALDRVQRAYERVDYRLNYLQSQQVGGFVGTLFGGGWGLNGNITLNSRIDALKGQKHYLAKQKADVTAQMTATLARDQQLIDTTTVTYNTASTNFNNAATQYQACLANPAAFVPKPA